MKNFLLYLSFIVILPTSFGKSGSSGCNSNKSDHSEDKTEHIKKENKKQESEPEDKGSDCVSNEISCCPFLSID